MKNKNGNLHNAKRAKNDEFYTLLTDIEKEMKNYREFFKGKIVYCNCDDARKSNFFKYFSMNFEFLGLKKLICTSYTKGGRGTVLVYEGDKNGNHIVEDDEITVSELEGDGDFRSEECVKFLKECDVVVTNPPFSLFREYIAQLMEYGKKFLIIGNKNALTYKEIFPLVKNNVLWLGTTMTCGGRFILPNSEKEFVSSSYKKNDGFNTVVICGAHWFTNIDHKIRNTFIDLYKKYTPEEYPQYDNYNAINVNKTCDIPMDYNEVMGVPITFLDKYCPEQFEIVGFRKGDDGKDVCYTIERESELARTLGCSLEELDKIYPVVSNGMLSNPKDTKINGKSKYARILIRHKKSDDTIDNGIHV